VDTYSAAKFSYMMTKETIRSLTETRTPTGYVPDSYFQLLAHVNWQYRQHRLSAYSTEHNFGQLCRPIVLISHYQLTRDYICLFTQNRVCTNPTEHNFHKISRGTYFSTTPVDSYAAVSALLSFIWQLSGRSLTWDDSDPVYQVNVNIARNIHYHANAFPTT